MRQAREERDRAQAERLRRRAEREAEVAINSDGSDDDGAGGTSRDGSNITNTCFGDELAVNGRDARPPRRVSGDPGAGFPKIKRSTPN